MLLETRNELENLVWWGGMALPCLRPWLKMLFRSPIFHFISLPRIAPSLVKNVFSDLSYFIFIYLSRILAIIS